MNEAAELLTFTFEQPMKLKYLKFELISYHGKGGGLQYFAAIPAECEGPGVLKPMVVQSTAHMGYDSDWPASSVLILEEQDGKLGNSGKNNYWLAERYTATDQGFTVRVHDCARMIAGVEIKNAKNYHQRATDEFKVTASLNG